MSGLLPDDAIEQFVRSLFSPFGDIASIKLYRNQWGKSKGDALITLGTERDAKSAIKALNGKEVRPGVPITASNADFKKSIPATAPKPATVSIFGATVPIHQAGFPMMNRQQDLASKSAAIAKEVEALKAMLGK